MKTLRLLPSARRDLDAIWDYTAQVWGLDQAESYVATLGRDMGRLQDYPELGPVHRSRVGAFRKFPSGHHLIFYQVTDANVVIVRVLHERMDVPGQLGGDEASLA